MNQHNTTKNSLSLSNTSSSRTTHKKLSKKPMHKHATPIWQSKFVFMFAYACVPRILKYLFRVTADVSEIKHLTPPFILIPNHKCVLDPLLYHIYIHHQMHFVTSDTHFRTFIFREFVMKFFGCISKKKGQGDSQTIKKLVHILNVQKHAVCIFAEGVNTWDGSANPITQSTASLIKFVKTPVLIAQAQGAYLTYPRWSTHFRRGSIKITYKKILSTKDIEGMKKSEIVQVLNRSLAYNEFEDQLVNQTKFPSPRRAEYVERVLFMCPYCEQTSSIISHKQYFRCKSCQKAWFMNQEGFFHIHKKNSVQTISHIHKNYWEEPYSAQNRDASVDNNMSTWNKWQNAMLIDLINKKNDHEIIFYDEDCELKYGKTRLVLSYGLGRITLTPNHIHFLPYKTVRARKFPLPNLVGCNVQNNEKLEWTLGKLVYQIKPKSPRTNTYKYMQAITYLQSKQNSTAKIIE